MHSAGILHLFAHALSENVKVIFLTAACWINLKITEIEFYKNRPKMSMLAERKRKQKFSLNPRGKTWSEGEFP